MSRANKSNNSTSKYRKKKISIIIPVIAVVEILILIAASTYSWFYLSANKEVETDIITVAPDSGLDIDFKTANTNDSINIWEYINNDFAFEPASSLDGRNIYFPTTGTFGNTDTTKMLFRDSTVNDINSKYINIDFELTNTDPSDTMSVYLNNSSYFYVKKYNASTGQYETNQSHALRLAFYTNNGASGNVGSTMVFNDTGSESTDSGSSGSGGSGSSDKMTLYFDNTSTEWGSVYAYLYDSHTYPDKYYRDTPNHEYEFGDWKDNPMTHLTGSVYSITITNPTVEKADTLSSTPVYQRDEKGDIVYQVDGNGDYVLDSNNEKIPVVSTYTDESGNTQTEYVPATTTAEPQYDTLIIHNGSGKQTVKLNAADGKIYKYNASASDYDISSDSVGDYSTNKVYFVKPAWWDNVYAYSWYSDGSGDHEYHTYPGDKMTDLGSGIYCYEYSSTNTGSVLFNNGDTNKSDWSLTKDNVMADGQVYYIYNQDDGISPKKYMSRAFQGTDKDGVSTYSYADMTPKTLYFYNSENFVTPYICAFVPTENTHANQSMVYIPLTWLSGSVYYCTIPQVYCQAYFYDANNTSNRTKLVGSSFNGKEDQSDVAVTSGYVYRPVEKTEGNSWGSDTYYPLKAFEYANYIQNDGYAVISPGTSAGFQRAYSPVVDIDHRTGSVQEILPAFANSIDNYINNSENTLFQLAPNTVLSLSMIIWLEGTDKDCNTEDYASDLIELRLEFSTQKVNRGETDVYTYKFLDKTNEIWTSDRIKTASGLTVSPVIQLYDNTIKRGYLMRKDPQGDKSYNGKIKTSIWTVQAPRSIVDYGHDIIFRRVNPYNEDEVWNYWHAGPCSTGTHDGVTNVSKGVIYSQAREVTSNGTMIYFTAFGNGSPSSDILTASESEITDVPERSCGGLWGNHTTRKLYVLDGRGAASGGYTNLTNNNAEVTIRYTYNYYYTTGGVTTAVPVDIEYTSSGYNEENCYNSIMIFVMPNDIYNRYSKYVSSGTTIYDEDENPTSTSTTCVFRKYQDKIEGYALNSPNNNRLKLFRSNEFTPDDNAPISGEFFEIGYKIKNPTNNSAELEPKNYWGSDILYFQNNYTTTNTNDDTASSMYTKFTNVDSDHDGNHLLRVRFFANKDYVYDGATKEIGKEDPGVGDAEDFYSYLFQNDNFGGSNRDYEHGFACVVPNDKTYYFYRAESCTNDETSIRNATKQIQLENLVQSTDYATSDYAVPYRNYAHFESDTKKSNSITKFNHYFHTIYFQADNTLVDIDHSPKCYAFKDNRVYLGEFPGSTMTWVADFNGGIKQYKIELASDAAKFQIYSTKVGKASNQKDNVGDSGYIYEYKNYSSDFTLGAPLPVRACKSFENIYSYFFATEWPHYNVNSIQGSTTYDY